MSNPSPVHALSTMWSQGRFPHKDRPDGRPLRASASGRDSMARFAETASQLGFPAVEINYVIPPEGVEELLASNHVSIASLHSPTPRVKAADGRWSEALNLAALDEEERTQAVRLACATVDHAVRAGARHAAGGPGGIGGGGGGRGRRCGARLTPTAGRALGLGFCGRGLLCLSTLRVPTRSSIPSGWRTVST